MSENLFKQSVAIVEDYLGPAAERFLKRQIEFHLDKESEDLTAREVRQMSEWVKTSLGLLTQDKNMVDECSQRLLKLVAADS